MTDDSRQERVYSFAPILGEEPILLILGSMPSVLSLETGRYYGNERNDFWRLVSAVLEEPYMEIYEKRVAMLIRRRVALWDSMRSCVRPGSLDKNIKEEEPNDIAMLLYENPTIHTVAFNGQMAEKMYFKYKKASCEVEYISLPSSSPVPRRNVKSFEDKLRVWLSLRHILK
ncbi:DNA-deoxyinosine glycosylase [Synergistales bacterium]|nr:DNA-deoxyinosine glycosylase [Synergistales bacterium]